MFTKGDILGNSNICDVKRQWHKGEEKGEGFCEVKATSAPAWYRLSKLDLAEVIRGSRPLNHLIADHL